MAFRKRPMDSQQPVAYHKQAENYRIAMPPPPPVVKPSLAVQTARADRDALVPSGLKPSLFGILEDDVRDCIATVGDVQMLPCLLQLDKRCSEIASAKKRLENCRSLTKQPFFIRITKQLFFIRLADVLGRFPSRTESTGDIIVLQKESKAFDKWHRESFFSETGLKKTRAIYTSALICSLHLLGAGPPVNLGFARDSCAHRRHSERRAPVRSFVSPLCPISMAKYKWQVDGNVHSHSGLCVGRCSDTLRPLWIAPWPGELEGGSLAIA